jgi:hypothetical protein
MVEVEAADVHQGVVTPLRSGAEVIGVEGPRFHGGVERRRHHRPALGIAVTVEAPHTIERLGGKHLASIEATLLVLCEVLGLLSLAPVVEGLSQVGRRQLPGGVD